jgi:hypothetical protein
MPAGVLQVLKILRNRPDDLLAVVNDIGRADGAGRGVIVVTGARAGVRGLQPDASLDLAERQILVEVQNVAIDLVDVELGVAGYVAVDDGLAARDLRDRKPGLIDDVGRRQGRIERRFRIVLVVVGIEGVLELQGRRDIAIQLGVVEVRCAW